MRREVVKETPPLFSVWTGACIHWCILSVVEAGSKRSDFWRALLLYLFWSRHLTAIKSINWQAKGVIFTKLVWGGRLIRGRLQKMLSHHSVPLQGASGAEQLTQSCPFLIKGQVLPEGSRPRILRCHSLARKSLCHGDYLYIYIYIYI